jgi:hypothetical protein
MIEEPLTSSNFLLYSTAASIYTLLKYSRMLEVVISYSEARKSGLVQFEIFF